MTSLFNLTGKTALVTGSNGGIGLGIARGLAQAGARVAIIARNTDKSHAAARALAEDTGLAPLVLTADVSSADQVAAVVNEAKKGLAQRCLVAETPSKLWVSSSRRRVSNETRVAESLPAELPS